MNGDQSYTVNIHVQFETGVTLPRDRLQQAAAWVLARLDAVAGTGLSVVIATDDDVRELNRMYRGVDKPTDVLSFAAETLPVSQDDDPYLGDLILALPYIQRQAQAEQHEWSDEMVLAVIHGTLHLLGYDHDTPANQSRMWAIQSEALAAMNVAISVPLFSFDDDDGQSENDAHDAGSSHTNEE